MSMPKAVRHINATRALEALFANGPMSRADLARDLSLTRSTASSIVSSLARDGVVIEIEDDGVDRGMKTGRPGTYVKLRPEHAYFIGADIGVGHKTVVALNLSADVVARASEPFDTRDSAPDAVVDGLVVQIERVLTRLPDRAAIRGLNVTVPGLLDRGGSVLRAPILGWTNVPLLDMLRQRLPGIPDIQAENDANAFAMAELYRAGKDAPQEAIYVLLDAGVGGGLVSGGKLLRGADGYAGEIGHISLADEGFVALATLPGSLESFVGLEAVLARHRFHGGTAATLDQFIAALEARTASALATARDWAHYMGRGLASLASVMNPQRIILGGPVAAMHQMVEAEVVASMRRHLLPGHPLPSVTVSALGSDGPAVGAAAILHRAMLTIDETLVFQGAGLKGEA